MQEINLDSSQKSKIDLERWEKVFRSELSHHEDLISDPAHDLSHFQRVVSTAKKLCLLENACLEIVVPAAWFHDFINLPKNDPRRSLASTLSADAAVEYLRKVGYPEEFLPGIHLAIRAHSFSAKIEATSLEAQVVQDADRLDALGAIGMARCFAVGGVLRRPIYHPEDPFAENRTLNDLEFAIDHFYTKLFKVAETLKTRAGREEGRKRTEIMHAFLQHLRSEVSILN
jgi:uncharacterized protein